MSEQPRCQSVKADTALLNMMLFFRCTLRPALSHASSRWTRAGVGILRELCSHILQAFIFVELKPLVGDVVFFINSEKRKSFGVIVEILSDKNQVSIRSKYQGSVQIRTVHVRVLTLLYRPSEWKNDIPVN